MPVITLVDTAGAYPGVGAEERGQAEAIARSTDCCLAIGVPLIAVVIGEGGSGGAVAIATANRILMLEHAIYTVASPEAAASILWRDSAQGHGCRDQHEDHGPGSAAGLGVIDDHRARNPSAALIATGRRPSKRVGDAIAKALAEFDGKSRRRDPPPAPGPLPRNRPLVVSRGRARGPRSGRL